MFHINKKKGTMNTVLLRSISALFLLIVVDL